MKQQLGVSKVECIHHQHPDLCPNESNFSEYLKASAFSIQP